MLAHLLSVKWNGGIKNVLHVEKMYSSILQKRKKF